jgi:hypothetical protein
MSKHRVLALLAALVVAAGLLPAVAQAGAPAARLAGDPGFEQPAVGACYDLTYEQAGRNSAPQAPVECTEPHNLQTILVKRLSNPVRWGSDGLFDRFAADCEKAMYTTLGGNIKASAMSAYSWWWFIPTKAQRAAGARWVRCDIGLKHASSDMDDLPESLKLGSLPLPDEVALCMVGDRYLLTQCKYRHQYKAKATFKLDRLPRSAEEYFRAARRCSRLLGYVNNYAYLGPSDYAWKAGNHFMVCLKLHR